MSWTNDVCMLLLGLSFNFKSDLFSISSKTEEELVTNGLRNVVEPMMTSSKSLSCLNFKCIKFTFIQKERKAENSHNYNSYLFNIFEPVVLVFSKSLVFFCLDAKKLISANNARFILVAPSYTM